MDRIKEFFTENDLFARHCGIELIEVGKGTARTRMKIQEHHLNGVRSVQGGAIFTLADLAFAAACNSHGTVAVAINVSITFIKAATGGTLTAEAKEVSVNPKLGTYSIQVTNDAGEVVATFQGLAYRKKESLESVMRKP
ncbi:MAG: PaaI family thioesterase [Phycisphaerae bacterium]